ncbi:MAG: 6-pyruvoyl-tetrahydropterin synthase-related protein [Candidatus Bathyarchaeota archaeon]
MSPNVFTQDLKWLVSIIVINFAVACFATQIFWQGYPLGIDTFSHLPKVFYLSKFGISSWHFDWYGGYPLFLFYPPLSYLVSYVPVALGMDALLSYKLVEFIFFMVTPYVFYKLCKTFELSRTRSLYGTLIFSIIPFTILNMMVFGRYPSIVGFPFFIVALIGIVGVIRTHSKKSFLVVSVFFSLTLLTNHLSAYVLAIIILIFVITLFFDRADLRYKFKIFFSICGSLALGLALASFWIIPFIVYVSYYSSVNISSSVFAMLPVSSLIFVAIIVSTIVIVKKIFYHSDFYTWALVSWILIFLLYGSTFLPSFLLPFGSEVDFLRFQLYLSVPLGIFLSCSKRYPLGHFTKPLRVLRVGRQIRTWVLIFIIANVGITAVIFQTSQSVLAQQVYIDVEDVPEPIIRYLKDADDYGRVMGINVPYWIYLLPEHTNKPLIDGWYPQGSIIAPIKAIGKPISLVDDDQVLLEFINNAQDFGIKWIVLGNSSKLYLFANSDFQPVITHTEYTLFENKLEVKYVSTEPSVSVSWRQENDSVIILLETKSEETTVTVKEAFFPSWTATDNDEQILLSQNKYNFIVFQVTGVGEHTVQLEFEPYREFTIW